MVHDFNMRIETYDGIDGPCDCVEPFLDILASNRGSGPLLVTVRSDNG